MSWTGDVQRIKKARKPHRCFWCGERIDAGQPYLRWFGRGDGPFTTRVHPECEAAWQRAIQLDDEYRYGVHEGTHARGCICDTGNCRCAKKGSDHGGADPVQAGEREPCGR